MINMRGHHLLCSLTYTGRGYSKKFEQEFTKIIERLKSNETILIVSGPDEICKSVEGCSDSHCLESRIFRRDELALEDISAQIGVPVKVGTQLAPSQLFNADFRSAYQNRAVRRACFDCQWSKTCDQIANTDFSSSLLLR